MAGIKGQKSGGHSTKGTGAGRPKGITKSVTLLGYRYTEEEATIIKNSLEKLKQKYGTISKGLFEVLKDYN